MPHPCINSCCSTTLSSSIASNLPPFTSPIAPTTAQYHFSLLHRCVFRRRLRPSSTAPSYGTVPLFVAPLLRHQSLLRRLNSHTTLVFVTPAVPSGVVLLLFPATPSPSTLKYCTTSTLVAFPLCPWPFFLPLQSMNRTSKRCPVAVLSAVASSPHPPNYRTTPIFVASRCVFRSRLSLSSL